MEIEKLGFSDVTLMVGERIDSGLNLQNGVGQVSDGDPDVILLTDKRVIHLQARGRRRSAAFVSLQDVESVEITSEREGFGAFI